MSAPFLPRYLQPQVEVASHRLKWVEYQVDTQGHRCELRYFRDIDGREVDFVLMHAGRPIGFVECKLTDSPLADGSRYLVARFPGIPAWQIAANGAQGLRHPRGHPRGTCTRVAPAADLIVRRGSRDGEVRLGCARTGRSCFS